MDKKVLIVILVLAICISCTASEDSGGHLVPRDGRIVRSDVGVYPERRHADIIHIYPPKRRRRRRKRRCLRRRPRPYYDRIDVSEKKLVYTDDQWKDNRYQKHFTIIPLIESAKSVGDGTKFIPIAIIRHDQRPSFLPNHYVNLKKSPPNGRAIPKYSYNIKFDGFPRFMQSPWDSFKVSRDQEEILKKVRKYAQPGWGGTFKPQEPVPGQILFPPNPLNDPRKVMDIPLGGFRGSNQDRWGHLKDFYERDIPRSPSIPKPSRGLFYEDQIHKNHRHYLARNSTDSRHENVKPVWEDVDEGPFQSSYRTTRPIVFLSPRSPNSTLLINQRAPQRDKTVMFMKMSGHMAGTNYSKSHPVFGALNTTKWEMSLGQKAIPTKKIPARWSPVVTSTTTAPTVQQSDRYSSVDIKPNMSFVVLPTR